MLLTSPAAALDILGKEGSTAHIEDVTRALGALSFNIVLFKKTLKNDGKCSLIASKLTEHFQTEQYP